MERVFELGSHTQPARFAVVAAGVGVWAFTTEHGCEALPQVPHRLRLAASEQQEQQHDCDHDRGP